MELGLKTNLLGTPDMVADRLRVYRDAGITTIRAGLRGQDARRAPADARQADGRRRGRES